MNRMSRTLVILLSGVLLGVLVAPNHYVFAEREQPAPLPLDDLRTFTEVFAKIKSDYVEPVDDKFLLEQAIRGMLSGLDPHSSYLNPEEYEELTIGTTGEFGGLGIEVGMENGFVKVIAPIDDTPAQRAGIQAGDLIIRLDDKPVKGLTLNECVTLMRGKPGTDITLTIVREGSDKPFPVVVTRDVIKVKSVKSKMLEPGFGYVRISQFQSHTAENLQEALDELKREAGGTLKGLVLDLRNNPGGVLNGAVAVSDAFLDGGLVVYTEGRTPDSELRYNAKPGDDIGRAPMVVLVNGGSASASEIVAGALQDHKRAVIMGTQTFGKGSVQTILPMVNNAALKLTTARYYTPSGRSIQAEGITPDIPVENVQVTDAEQGGLDRLKEADLTGHLANGNGKPDAKGAGVESEKEALSLAKSDYQLFEAVNLLKGLTILEQRK